MPDPRLPIEDRIVAAIRQIIRAVDLHSKRLVEEHGLTGPQLAILQEADRLAPVSPGVLARAVHLSHPTVTGILGRLETRGLIRRERGTEDRRTVLVHVSDAGHAALASAPSLLQDRFREELDRLEEWEQHQTLAVLQRVASLMGAEALDAAPHLATGTQLAPAGDDAAAPADVDATSKPASRAAPRRARPRSPRRKPSRDEPS